MIVLPYRERGYERFVSTRTGETIFELKTIENSMIVWGSCYRPDEFTARLADGAITLCGTLRDRLGAVVTFGDTLDIAAPFSVELGDLPSGYSPAWSRDRT